MLGFLLFLSFFIHLLLNVLFLIINEIYVENVEKY